MIIDLAVHPLFEDDVFKRELGQPWSDAPLPHLLGHHYAAPFDEIVGDRPALVDPEAAGKVLFADRGINAAVLTPTTRGWFPNPQQSHAVCHATNRLLNDIWLTSEAYRDHYYGSIRLPLNDTSAALHELELWADDPRFVHIAVPLRATAPFGDERYFPIWEAAVDLGLPIFVHDDLGSIAEPGPGEAGWPRYFAEHHALRPRTVFVHVSSLVTSGVFGRLPELRFIFGDGGLQHVRPMLWRVDKDWRSSRVEMPWVDAPPSSFPERHVRFAVLPEDVSGAAGSAAATPPQELAPLAVFGSRYPYWDQVPPADLGGWSDEDAGCVFEHNALEFYPRLAHLADGGRVPSEAVERS